MRKTYRYSIGGYEGDQLQSLVRQILNDADADPLGREPLREIVEALYKHVTVWRGPEACGDDHVIGNKTDSCFACLSEQRDELLALVREASEIMNITYAGNFPAGIESFLARAAKVR